MACPEDEAWMAYLEGSRERAPELERHLETCGVCREAVDAARRALAALSNLSPGSRALCPPPDELAEAGSGMAKLSVRLHAALCPECADELVDLAALEEEPAGEVVLRWLADGLAVVSQTLSALAPEPLPALAARAGGPAAPGGWRLVQDLDGAELELELAPGDSHLFALSVALKPAPPAGTRVDLEANERLLASRALERGGLLSFLGLPPGRYRLTVRRPAWPSVVTELCVESPEK